MPFKGVMLLLLNVTNIGSLELIWNRYLYKFLFKRKEPLQKWLHNHHLLSSRLWMVRRKTLQTIRIYRLCTGRPLWRMKMIVTRGNHVRVFTPRHFTLSNFNLWKPTTLISWLTGRPTSQQFKSHGYELIIPRNRS